MNCSQVSVWSAWVSTRRAGAAALLALGVAACQETYRVGEHVEVQWCDAVYPGFITAKKGATRYRVHFDGYASRWDTDVSFERIVGKVDDGANAPPPPLCPKVALALGIKKDDGDAAARYKAGARVKVSWRGSVYKATIVKVKGPDRFLVHYDGHESAWDEVVHSDRILGASK